MTNRPLAFGVIGADHNHIHRMAADLTASGAVCKGWWTRQEPETLGGTVRPFPGTPRVRDYRQLLDDPDVDVVLVAALPNERATLAIEAMRAGKDVMSDKPGATTLTDVERLRECIAATKRIWSVNFSERYWVRAVVKAAELVAQGVIGDVIHTAGLGPHRGRFGTRPPWFFERAQSGGVINDLASHQIDHFVYFTRSEDVRIVAASVANFTLPEQPEFEDFGEVFLQGERASGYARVDWLTPDGQTYFGDNRLTILGTLGTIEVRKYVDLAGRPGGDHLFVARGAENERVDCTHVSLPYVADFVRDVRERSSTAERPGHSLLVSEITVRAQEMARRLGHLAR